MSAGIEDVRIVAATVFKPEALDMWMSSPNPMLEGRTPLQACADGEADRVLAVVDALAEGVTS